MTFADQEQTERGASTVPLEVMLTRVAQSAAFAEEHGYNALTGADAYWMLTTIERLRADLERVTAETKRATDHWVAFEAEAHRWQDRAEQAEAERDAMREVEQVARDIAGGRAYLLPTYLRPLVSALARLDATSKATADAAEEGK